MFSVLLAAAFVLFGGIAFAEVPSVAPTVSISSTGILESYNRIENRNLDTWKRDIAAYSARHYGIDSWKLEPTAIVLHYTAGSGFPYNLIESSTFMGEAPGVASHFVIDEVNGAGIAYQLLPLDVMSRATFGANFCTISIEMIARDENDLLGKKALLDTAISLVRELMDRYGIPLARVYGHAEIDALLAVDPHGEFYDNTIEGAFVPRKVDPGESVMALFRDALSKDTHSTSER
jgi:N-acetyl-anhydromuramyl-L-alanine amidase AmpD